MKTRSWAALLAAVALSLALAAPVAAGLRPFRADVAGADRIGDVSTCPAGALVRYVSNGEGVALHLGPVELAVSHCVWPDSPTTGHFGSGTITLTAPNGDTLILSQTGTYAFDAFPPTTSTIVLSWSVVGGTGRFADATGSGVGNGLSDIAAGTTHTVLTGSIDY